MNSTSARLDLRRSLLLASLMFGLFFGAGNLIFPVSLGLLSGSAVGWSAAGFLLAAVGLPILGVIGSALSGTTSLHELASRVGPVFAVVFTCALYLTIGPFFAIPRTATVSFEMANGTWLSGAAKSWALVAFTAVFFGLVLVAALRPGRLLEIVGRWLTPVFLVLLTLLLVVALASGGSATPPPTELYAAHPGAQGVLDGYNTMDALASLAFAIVIIEAARQLGVTNPRSIAREVGRSGVWAAVAMALIYVALALLGARSTGLVPRDANGAVALSAVAQDHFGALGHGLAAAIMLVACLKTAIGLVVACSEMFATMFPRSLSQRSWAVAFSLVSFGLANVGLATIIKASIPVLLLLYPLAIVLIALGLLDVWVRGRRLAHVLPMTLAGVVSLLSVLATTAGVPTTLGRAAARVGAPLPGFELGFGWILPAVVGLLVGLLVQRSAQPIEARTNR